MKKKAKKRPGRPPAAGGRVKLTTTLAPATVQWLRVIGVGSIAKAIEHFVSDELAENYETWAQLAKDHGWWDESMSRPDNLKSVEEARRVYRKGVKRPVNQTGDK